MTWSNVRLVLLVDMMVLYLGECAEITWSCRRRSARMPGSVSRRRMWSSSRSREGCPVCCGRRVGGTGYNVDIDHYDSRKVEADPIDQQASPG